MLFNKLYRNARKSKIENRKSPQLKRNAKNDYDKDTPYHTQPTTTRTTTSTPTH